MYVCLCVCVSILSALLTFIVFFFLSQSDLQICRHSIQLLAFVFSNAKIIGAMSTIIVVPYLHATGAPFSTVVGAFDALEYSTSRGVLPIFVLGVIYLTTICVGKLFCGWACPVGMIQDFLAYLPFQKRKPSPEVIAQFKDLRWAVVVFAFAVAFVVGIRRSGKEVEYTNYLGAFTDAPFSVISPGSTLFAYIPWMFLWKHNVIAAAGYIGWLKIVLFLAFLVPAVYVPRFFCRYVCPLGAIMDLVMPYRILRINCSDQKKGNSVLASVCPTGAVVAGSTVSNACIHCGKCLVESPDVFNQVPY